MKKLLFASIYLIALSSFCFGQGKWTQKADLAVGRYYAAGFSIGTKGYIGTGNTGTSRNDFWEWNQSTNVWTQKADFGGTARYGAVGFAIGTKGYIGTGYDGTYKQDFWEWDQSTNVWTQKANFTGAIRYFAVGFSIGTKGYIGTGYGASTYYSDFYEYDQVTNTWIAKAAFPGAGRYLATGFSIGTKGYIGTGNASGTRMQDFYEWNQATNAWTAKTNFGGTARYGCFAFSVGTKGYIGTGHDGAYKNDVWEWDQTGNTWLQKANFGGGTRLYAVGFSMGGTKGYVGTGLSGSSKRDFWELDQATDTWTQKADFAPAERKDAVGFAIGTKGYIGTGSGSGGNKQDFYEWNQATNAWSQKTDFGGTARSSAAAFYIGTKGYIGTGNSQDFWEWNQSTGVWTQKANFGGTSRSDALGFSIGTKGYIGTGGGNLQDFWEYDQTANTWVAKANLGGVGRFKAAGFSIGTKGYIGTGWGSSGALQDFWEWNQATNVWAQKANFGGAARDRAVGFALGTKGYVGVGWTGSAMKQDFWEYNPTTNTWIAKADFAGTARYDAVGFSAGTKGYIGTGYDGSGNQDDFWEYDPCGTFTMSVSQTNVSCNGGSNGSATLSLGGGTSPYTFSWSNGAVTQNVASLSAAVYTVTVTDNNGCSIVSTVNITQPSVLTASISSQTNVSCKGGTNGTALASVSGGTLPYTYSWNTTPAQTSQTATGLAAGNYTVSVTDSKGCAKTASVTITQPGALAANIVTIVHVSCNGGNNGSMSVSASDGTSPYSYSWTNGQTAASATGLTAGGYTVTVTDNKGCTKTASGTITQPGTISLNTSKTNVSCYQQANGSATVTASGGTSPYTYLWTNGQTTTAISGLVAGGYSVTVTDNKGCTKSANVNITQPNALAVTMSQTNILCNGQTNGTAAATPSGGTAPFTYSWTPGGATSSSISGLGLGNYSVTVTDSKGCVKSNSVTITQPAVLSASHTQQNVSCNGGADASVNVTVAGGTAPFTYSWSSSETTEDITGLGANGYLLTIIDANGCTTTDFTTITQPGALAATVGNTNATCGGTCNATATVTPTSGTAPYTYLWNDPSAQITQVATGLCAGTHSVTISDAKQCLLQKGVTVTEPAPISVSTGSNAASCGIADGSASASVTGGSAPYTYSWTSGATTSSSSGLAAGVYTVTVTDATGCTKVTTANVNSGSGFSTSYTQVNVSCNGGNNGSVNLTVSGGTQPYTFLWDNSDITEDISGLTAGNYNVTVTDNNNCIAVNAVTITEPAILSSSISADDVLCYNGNSGNATLTVNGGTSPYTFSWTNASATQNLSNLLAGGYTVTITDSKNCTKKDSVKILQPSSYTITPSVTNATCFGGSDGGVTMNVSGATPAYTFSWSTGGITQTISSVPSATYTFTVTDSNMCGQTTTVSVGQPAAVSVTFSITNVSCNSGSNGSAQANVTAGVSPFTYSWDAGAGSQITQTATGLASGNYTVTVTDGNLCNGTFTVAITEPAVLASSINGTNANCNGQSNGAADLTVSGGTTPYTYSWSTGSATTQDLSGLPAGGYTVTITDNKGCTKKDSVTITHPNLLVVTIGKTDVTCNGACDGTATANVSGGTTPYLYSWQTGPVQTTQTATGLCPASYNLNVTDNKGCQATPNVAISQPQPLTATVTPTGASCNNANGSATASPSGGTTPYTYAWSNNDMNQTANNLQAGNYTVTITDANACALTLTVSVNTVAIPQSLCIVTVDNTSTKNILVWEKPVNVPIDSFRIYREIASVFAPIATVSYESISTFTDTTNGVNPNITSYKYKISSLDTCGNESVLSSFHRTINLSVVPKNPCGYTLLWNDYIGFPVTQYRIWRDSSSSGWKAVDSVSFGNNQWSDITCYNVTDTLSYMVEIDHPTGCSASMANPWPEAINLNSSKSNVYRTTDSTLMTGMQNRGVEFLVNIFPNPNRGVFTISIHGNTNISGEIRVMNMLGERVYEGPIFGNKATVDISTLPQGVYSVQILSDEKMSTRKVIIE